MVVSKNGGTLNSWMVYNGKAYLNDLKWMIWGYPYFRKLPYHRISFSNLAATLPAGSTTELDRKASTTSQPAAAVGQQRLQPKKLRGCDGAHGRSKAFQNR